MLSGGLGVGFWTPFGVQLGVQKRSEKKVIFRERPSVRDLGQRRAPGGGGEVSAIAQTSHLGGSLDDNYFYLAWF